MIGSVQLAHSGATCVVVGYALNAKKLRKSSHDHSFAAVVGDGREGEDSRLRDTSGKDRCVVHDWSGGGLADILDSSSGTAGTSSSCAELPLVQFVQLDYEVPVSKQPHCSVLIHKLTEDIGNESKESQSKLLALDQYLREHPRTVIVDPIECVARVVSRERTCRHLTAIQERLRGSCPFAQPNYVVIEEQLGEEKLLAKLAIEQLVFPVICKPVQACGTAKSHSMVILTKSADVSLIEAPCVVQQYHDHGEILYKVYVIDKDVMAFRRRSLPDLLAGGDIPSTGCRYLDGQRGPSSDCVVEGGLCTPLRCSCLRSLAFDSRRNYPVYRDFVCDRCGEAAGSDRRAAPSSGPGEGRETEKALIALFEQSAVAIQEEFGLSLFGFDAIVPQHRRGGDCSGNSSVGGGGVTVIDVNYFPSYKEVRDFPVRLKRFLASRSPAPTPAPAAEPSSC